MIDLSISATLIVHGIHYAVVGLGLLGVAVLIGPQLLGRSAPQVHGEHERRVQLLNQQIGAGTLGSAPTTLLEDRPSSPSEPRADLRSSFLLPVAVISSAAAAGVHAAVGPEHFRERFLFGLFFAGSALAQIIWALLAAVRPSRLLLLAAVVGNLATLVLWTLTRTVGLGALLPAPEAVGGWDVTCGAWELVTLACAVGLLRTRGPLPGLLRWADWDVRARVWAVGSALLLAALSLRGAGA